VTTTLRRPFHFSIAGSGRFELSHEFGYSWGDGKSGDEEKSIQSAISTASHDVLHQRVDEAVAIEPSPQRHGDTERGIDDGQRQNHAK
jgi:preprotein translocase subunit SecD